MIYVFNEKKVYKIQSTFVGLFGTKNPGKLGVAWHFSKHNGPWPSAYSSAFIFSRELFSYQRNWSKSS